MASYLLLEPNNNPPNEGLLEALPGAVRAILDASPPKRRDEVRAQIRPLIELATELAGRSLGDSHEKDYAIEASASAALVDMRDPRRVGFRPHTYWFDRFAQAVLASGDQDKLHQLLVNGATSGSEAMVLCELLTRAFPNRTSDITKSVALALIGGVEINLPAAQDPPPLSANLLITHASMLIELGDLQEAETCLGEVLDAPPHPEMEVATLIRGDLLSLLGRHRDAHAVLKQGIAQWPQNALMRASDARALLLEGRIAEALEAFGPFPDEEDPSGWWPLWRGLAARLTGDLSQADTYFKQALRQGKAVKARNNLWPANMAHYFLVNGLIDHALTIYQLLLQPDEVPGARLIARLELEQMHALAPDLPGIDIAITALDPAPEN